MKTFLRYIIALMCCCTSLIAANVGTITVSVDCTINTNDLASLTNGSILVIDSRGKPTSLYVSGSGGIAVSQGVGTLTIDGSGVSGGGGGSANSLTNANANQFNIANFILNILSGAQLTNVDANGLTNRGTSTFTGAARFDGNLSAGSSAFLNSLTVSNAASLLSTLSVSGASTLSGNTTLGALEIDTQITLPSSLHFNGSRQWQRTNAIASGSLSVTLTNLTADTIYRLIVDSTGGDGTTAITFPGQISPGTCDTNGVSVYTILKTGTTTNIWLDTRPITYTQGFGVVFTTNSQFAVTISGLPIIKTAFNTNYTALATVGSPSALFCTGTNQLITLPSAATQSGLMLSIMAATTTGSVIVTNSNGSQTILGALSQSISATNRLTVISDGSNWW